MATLEVKNVKGEKVGTHELHDAIFGVRAKDAVIHQVVTAIQANNRSAIAHTKTKGEVAGGGKKPWAQKGTGRARVGSTRSPIWRGGGITFGPRSDRNFTQKINDKVRKLSLKAVLTDKLGAQKFFAVDSLESIKKTKDAIALLQHYNAHGSSVLVISGERDLAVMKAFNNIPRVTVCPVSLLNTLDIVKHAVVIIDLDGLKKLHLWLAPKQ